MSLLSNMRGDRKGWYKVSDLTPGVEIAVPSESGELLWDEVVSIQPVGREHVYDIEVEGTHNFVGNGIFAHNTYVLRANTALAVEGEVNASTFVSPAPIASTTLMKEIPSAVLTADGLGVDLYKLATYNLAAANVLAARMDETEVRVASLESRLTALESGAISSASGSPVSLTPDTLVSVLQDFGILVQRGIAQFQTLVFRQLVASKDADGTSSAGTVAIPAGSALALVENSLVQPSTKIFVTFNSQITGSWWVSDKVAGSFRVVLSAPQAADVTFDYFLVQTESALATSSPMTANGTNGTDTTNGTNGATDTVAPPPTEVTSTEPAASSDTAAPAVSDVEPPVVALVGEAAIQLAVGDAWSDPGATATDDTDGDLTTHITVSGAVDTATEGSYTLTYSATDAAGNTGSVSRLVTVLASAAPAPESAPAPEPAPEASATTP